MTEHITPLILESNFLKHVGQKGMKWGVRKERRTAEVVLTKKFKTGGSLTVTKDPPVAIAKFLSKISSKYKEGVSKYTSFTMRDATGKKVGEAAFNRESSKELNLVWLGVKQSERGKGYATAVFEGAVNYGRANGIKKLTLEVPGNAPDALHIYEKFGFKKVKVIYADTDDIWGGLTSMELIIPQKTLTHSLLDVNSLADYIADAVDRIPITHREEVTMSMLSKSDFLEHVGQKGMKWGVRKNRGTSGSQTSSRRSSTGRKSADAARITKIKSRIKKNGMDNLSNDDIAKLNKRTQLVDQYKKDNPGVIKKGRDGVKEALAVAATITAVAALSVKVVNSPMVQRGAAYVANIAKQAVFNQ